MRGNVREDTERGCVCERQTDGEREMVSVWVCEKVSERERERERGRERERRKQTLSREL